MTESQDIQENLRAKIAALNDAFRQSFCGGKVFLTQGVAALPAAEQAALLDKVRRFNTFTEENDPYGEHDFGSISFDGERYFWKIDYYDRLMDEAGIAQGSEAPGNEQVTLRVLTVMRADEY